MNECEHAPQPPVEEPDFILILAPLAFGELHPTVVRAGDQRERFQLMVGIEFRIEHVQYVVPCGIDRHAAGLVDDSGAAFERAHHDGTAAVVAVGDAPAALDESAQWFAVVEDALKFDPVGLQMTGEFAQCPDPAFDTDGHQPGQGRGGDHHGPPAVGQHLLHGRDVGASLRPGREHAQQQIVGVVRLDLSELMERLQRRSRDEAEVVEQSALFTSERVGAEQVLDAIVFIDQARGGDFDPWCHRMLEGDRCFPVRRRVGVGRCIVGQKVVLGQRARLEDAGSIDHLPADRPPVGDFHFIGVHRVDVAQNEFDVFGSNLKSLQPEIK